MMSWWKSDCTERLIELRRVQDQQSELLNWLTKHVNHIELKLLKGTDPKLKIAIFALSVSVEQLDEAIRKSQSCGLAQSISENEKVNFMAADLSDEIAAVERAKTVIDSATVLISGFQSRLDNAVAAALENGATAEQLQPLSDLSVELDAKAQELADAVAANTPAG